MSDSYSAYCERIECEARMFSDKNINSVKHTDEFKKLLKKAKDAYKNTKLYEAKSCQNCMHRNWLNSKVVCEKLGIILKDDNLVYNLVCKKWIGSSYTPSKPKLNENAIAWLIIDKNKFDYGY